MDENVVKAGEEKLTPPEVKAPKGRKYTYLGKRYLDPKVVNDYNGVRIRPWDMTDEDIDKLLATRPDLKRLWRVN